VTELVAEFSASAYLTDTKVSRLRWIPNELFLASLAYRRYKLFYYASVTDCTAENILNPIWLRGKEFPQAKAHLDTILTPETSPRIQSRIIHETLNDPAHMPRVGIADRKIF
jgi:hypothetical protein